MLFFHDWQRLAHNYRVVVKLPHSPAGRAASPPSHKHSRPVSFTPISLLDNEALRDVVLNHFGFDSKEFIVRVRGDSDVQLSDHSSSSSPSDPGVSNLSKPESQFCPQSRLIKTCWEPQILCNLSWKKTNLDICCSFFVVFFKKKNHFVFVFRFRNKEKHKIFIIFIKTQLHTSF